MDLLITYEETCWRETALATFVVTVQNADSPRHTVGVPLSSIGQTTPDVAVLLSEGQSGVHHLLGLIGGYAEKVGDPHFFRGG